MIISPSGPITKHPGSNFSLVCSANIYPPPVYGSSLILEWFFGPENSSLPPDVVVSNTKNDSDNYTSTLQFSQLHENHTGIYTCKIGYSAASIIIFFSGKWKRQLISYIVHLHNVIILYSSRSYCPHQQCW